MKKIIAIALALMLCVSVMSVSAFAAPAGLNGLAIVGANIPGVADWTPADAAGEMTEVSESVYEITLDVAAGAAMTVKFAGNDTWDDNFNFGGSVDGQPIVIGTAMDLTNGSGAQNMSLTVANAGQLKFTVDLTALADGGNATLLVTEVGAEGGDNTGDNTGDTTGDNTTGDNTGDEENNETVVPVDPNATYRVAGLATLCGSEWDVTDDNNKMVAGDNGIYTITYKNVAAGDYEFKVAKNGSWDENWGKDGFNTDNIKFTVETAGDVTISFNPATGKISVAGAGVPETGDFAMTGIVIMMVLATAGAAALVYSKKKFF